MKAPRDKVRLGAQIILFLVLVAAIARFNWLRAIYMLLAFIGLFLALCALLAIPIALWHRRRSR